VFAVLYTHALFPGLRHSSENGFESHGPDQCEIMFETDVDTLKEIVYDGMEPVNAVIKGKMKVHGKKSLIFKLRNVLR
jgi:putative sterol carrier protein